MANSISPTKSKTTARHTLGRQHIERQEMNERNIELAIEAGFDGRREWPPMYKKFADLIRADEREACAEIDFFELLRSVCSKEQAEEYADLISTAIRARGNK